ncbi:MAG: LOW QUALITY PROTEIN: hypothetical protein KVP17_000754 [Porospora cf. gigantea B]|uniref:uncharacterized protein n=1 Tax=Porospora cf. gigantea B TaxID=2853592 RepID=UPI003571AAC2|nr:MAG: LOW QUALITY PROTEIN: hypothetical protein KVP17_000754 [Porospora cf. gigantea B]
MLSARLLDLADYVARFARNVKDQWFGGLQMVFVGDFFQLGKVMLHTEPVDAALHGWAFEAQSWAAVRAVINMRHNYRAAADPIFCQHLELLRRGEGPSASDLRYLLVNRPLKCPTVVFATNHEADAMNARKIDELSGPKLIYKALNASVAHLTLCKNCHVMTTRSLILDGVRVPNGARGTVFSFQPFKSSPEMAFWEAQSVKQVPIVHLPNYGTFPIYPTRLQSAGGSDAVQLPLKLAFAATAHRLQGHSIPELDACAVRVFAHGHLYSMLSRVMSSRGLVLSGLDSVADLHEVLARNQETIDPKVRQFYTDIGC